MSTTITATEFVDRLEQIEADIRALRSDTLEAQISKPLHKFVTELERLFETNAADLGTYKNQAREHAT